MHKPWIILSTKFKIYICFSLTEFKILRKLKVLSLDEVFTNGSIPLVLKLVEAFPSVKTFYLRRNYLNKTMATPTHGKSLIYSKKTLICSLTSNTSYDYSELHVWSNVEEIFLDHSYLNNNILQSIGVLTSLKTLSLSNCGLIGSLPDQGKFMAQIKTP